MGWNVSRGIILSWDRTTPGESFCQGVILSWSHSVLESFCPGFIPGQMDSRKELLQGSNSVLGWNDSRGDILSWDGTTPGSHSVMGWNDSRGVILSWDGTTPGESFCPGVERLQGRYFVLGWNNTRGVILSWVGTTPRESFCPWMEQLPGSHSVLVKRILGSPSVLA